MVVSLRSCALILLAVTLGPLSSSCIRECERFDECGAEAYCSSDGKCVPYEGAVDAGPVDLTPGCTARVYSVNGDQLLLGETPRVAPLDDVVVAADIRNLAGDRTYSWEVVARPDDSTVELTRPDGPSTQFTFADGVLGVDLPNSTSSPPTASSRSSRGSSRWRTWTST
jgi:hypothetical protein